MSSFCEKGEGENNEEVNLCRICLEPEIEGDNMISPCGCAGSQKYVHSECLSRWQATVLFQEKSSTPNEKRHLTCSTCGSDFHGMSVPTRKKLLAAVCGDEIVSSLQIGSFLVATRANSERTISNNFPALVAALFKLKRAHWQYSVYFIFSTSITNDEDVEGESKVFGLNLTRLMDGSTDHPIPDEVLTQQQIHHDSNEVKEDNAEDDALDFPRISIQHHNGGPVKWSSHRSAVCIVPIELERLRETLRLHGFVSGNDHPDRNEDAPVFLTSFVLLPMPTPSTMVVGKFSLVMEMVQCLRHLFLDGTNISVFSYSGYAEWTTAQLLREIARGSWGVISPDKGFVAYEELMNPSQLEYPSLDELRDVPKVASLTERMSCNANDDTVEHEIDNVKESLDNRGERRGPPRQIVLEDEKDLTQTLSTYSGERVVNTRPRSERLPKSDSADRARAASNTAGAAGRLGSGVCRSEKYDKELLSSPNAAKFFKQHIREVDQSNIWDKLIRVSIEAHDNVIKQSYT